MPTSKEKIKRLPKVELHRHLEGSLRPETIVELASKYDINIPSYDVERLRPYIQITNDFPNFHTYLDKFRLLRRLYAHYEAIERATYEAIADAAADNVKYLELRFSPANLANNGRFILHEVMDRVLDVAAQAQRDYDIVVRLLATLRRDQDSQEIAWQIARAAVAHLGKGLVGLDLAGDEVNYPAELFSEIFQMARAEGLGVTIHAGEARGADSVRTAIEKLNAHRIGHGVHIIEDSATMALAKKREVTLELCPTSNVQTGAVSGLSTHPLRELHHAGVRVTINTDNPSISRTTLSEEYSAVMRVLGVTWTELSEMILNGVRASFLPPAEQQQMMEKFRRQIAAVISGESTTTARPHLVSEQKIHVMALTGVNS